MIGRWVKVARQQAETPGKTRPHGAVTATDRVQVPALAAAGIPHGVAQAALQLAVELVLHCLFDFQALQLLLTHQLECTEHVMDLRLDHVDHRVVAQAGVRPHQEEQVGETGSQRAFIRLRAFRPGVEQVDAATAEHHATWQRIAWGETGAEDDCVNLALFTVHGADAATADFLDAIGDQVDVGLGQRREVIVGDQHALATHQVIRGDLGAQHRVLDLFVDVPLADFLRDGHHLGQHGKADHPAFQQGIDGAAPEFLQQREAFEAVALALADGAVRLGHDPRCGALVQIELADLLLDLRHELDRRGAGADYRNALAGKVIAVVPLLRVEDLAGEVAQALERRNRWGGQRAHAGHDKLRGIVVACAVTDLPQLLLFIPGQAGDFGIQLGVVLQAVLAPAAFQVTLDFWLLGKHARPVGVLLERKRIQMRLHVTAATRVVVDPPGTADAGFFLEQQKVMFAGLLQADGHAQAGEARADNGHLAVAGGSWG